MSKSFFGIDCSATPEPVFVEVRNGVAVREGQFYCGTPLVELIEPSNCAGVYVTEADARHYVEFIDRLRNHVGDQHMRVVAEPSYNFIYRRLVAEWTDNHNMISHSAPELRETFEIISEEPNAQQVNSEMLHAFALVRDNLK